MAHEWDIILAGGGLAFLRVKPDFRARGQVERFVMVTLLLAWSRWKSGRCSP